MSYSEKGILLGQAGVARYDASFNEASQGGPMETNDRRSFFGKMAAIAAFLTGTPKLFAQQTPASGTPAAAPVPGGDMPRRPGGGNHVHDGIYYFSGTGSNDG